MKYLMAAVALLALTACDQQSDKKAEGAPAAIAADIPAGDYKLDKSHASLTFRVDHLGFSIYTARFTSLDATLKFDPKNPTAAVFNGTVDPNSLDVPSPPENFLNDLRGPQWLDTAKYPEITFRSTKVELTGANTANITGDFTLHGVTKPLVLAATFNGGYAGHPYDPNARIGFSANGSLKRSDFGIAYGIPAPGTKMGVGDEVQVALESEFTGPPLAGAAAAPAHP
ncbi:MAG: YceI family protein [Parvibaculum sp.]|uniref:YceI family protein n=1 Tax=Parvibaculum sp. TaxID=2024848 RepID=UPI0025F023DD|nr:YceI family protein [Parvibaculum sp.]MCE9650039.1 YceI family protein [Parvibaculum sp.]